MGEPETTRKELQATVGWQSRNAWWNDRLIRRSAGDSLLWHATKLGLLSAAAQLIATCGLIFLLDFQEVVLWTAKARLAAWVLTCFSLLFGAGMFIGAIFCGPIWRLASRGFRASGDYVRVAVIALSIGAAMWGLGLGFTFAVARDYAASLQVASQWLAFSIVVTPLFLVLPWLDVRERRPLAEWLELDLAE